MPKGVAFLSFAWLASLPVHQMPCAHLTDLGKPSAWRQLQLKQVGQQRSCWVYASPGWAAELLHAPGREQLQHTQSLYSRGWALRQASWRCCAGLRLSCSAGSQSQVCE